DRERQQDQRSAVKQPGQRITVKLRIALEIAEEGARRPDHERAGEYLAVEDRDADETGNYRDRPQHQTHRVDVADEIGIAAQAETRTLQAADQDQATEERRQIGIERAIEDRRSA